MAETTKNDDRRNSTFYVFLCLLFSVSLTSITIVQDDGNLDDYKICTFSGELEEIRKNIWREKKECHWHPNVTESTIEFIEKWGRWPQIITRIIYAPVLLSTVFLSYHSICCKYKCVYAGAIPFHISLAEKFGVWLGFEVLALIPMLFVTLYPGYVTSDVNDAYERHASTYVFLYTICLGYQDRFLSVIKEYHKDENVAEASDDTANQRLTRSISKV
ncbi:hypothetical protein M3Y95_00829200 [Aphelenchoides besseyi]|nr:hypothetical protein M3Y95_00829200 [Aphelenchoides besseyi]